MLEKPSITCGNRILDLSRPQVMGVLNVTPDSFSDGGYFMSAQKAIDHGRQMEDEGAGIIDIGGESTRPGAKPVPVNEELDRVIPVVQALSRHCQSVISVDTSTPEVIREASRAGAHLINDVRALRREGALAAARAAGLPVSLMHMQGEPGHMQESPQYENVVIEVTTFLAQRIADCTEAGIPHERLLVDPGFGFGKTLHHNLQLLRQLEKLESLGCPVLVGMSRKSMIGAILDKPADERLAGSLAVAVMAVERGAHIVRAHDVSATVDALQMVQAVIKD